MLNKLIEKKNLMLIIYVAFLLVFWTLALIFGNREDKLMVLLLFLVSPFAMYALIRLMYKIVSRNYSLKTLCFFYCIFLAVGLLGTVMMIVEFIGGFPNGLSPTLGACGALIIATLDSAKENIGI
jgi:hypothetical protein